MTERRTAAMLTSLVVGCLLSAAALSWADPATEVKPSAYAPAADLEQQLTFYLGRLNDGLASESEYDEAKQSRAVKDANTVLAIVYVLGMHDEPNPLREHASPALGAAQKLCQHTGSYAQARADLYALQTAVRSGEQQGELKWGESGTELAALMKQVPVVNNSLRRSLEPCAICPAERRSGRTSGNLGSDCPDDIV